MLKVYTTKTCAYCPMVKKYLTMKGQKYEEVDVTDDQATRAELVEKTGYTTVPVTTDGEIYVVGWKPAELAKLIAR